MQQRVERGGMVAKATAGGGGCGWPSRAGKPLLSGTHACLAHAHARAQPHTPTLLPMPRSSELLPARESPPEPRSSRSSDCAQPSSTGARAGRPSDCAKISLVQISKSVEFLKSQFTLKWLLYVANDRRLFSQLTGGLHHTVFQLGSIRVHSLHWWDGLSLISS